MNVRIFLKALAYKAKRGLSSGKRLTKSYISLFLVFILAISSTTAWFLSREAMKIYSNNLEFQSASSLRINKDKSLSNRIIIDNVTLDEASSLDGRNLYFPLGASFSGNTADMFFREANKGDENVHYVYKDFELKGTSGNTPVYIKSYEVKVEDADGDTDSTNDDVNAIYHDQLKINFDDNTGKPASQYLPHHQCPIRLAFISDSGQKPVVIDPSAQVVNYVDNSADAVELVDENGVPTTKDTYHNNNNWNSFQSYYYGNTPLFVIPGGRTLNVTLVVWLEGTLPDCDKYIGKKISVDIDIESNFAEMETITFYDDSQPDNSGGQAHWVSNQVNNGGVLKDPIVACSYEDPYSDETPKRWKTVIMTKSSSDNYTWTCKIPKKVVKKISFYRLNPFNGTDQGTIFNAWYTHPNVSSWLNPGIKSSWFTKGSLQTTRQFTDSNGNKYNSLVYRAIHGNGYGLVTESTVNYKAKRLSPCIGYWDTEGNSGGSVTPTESSGGSSATTYSVIVVVVTKGWVGSNVGSGSRLHFTTSSGGDYAYTTSTNTTHFEQTFTLNNEDEITGFYLLHTGGAKTNLRVNSIFEVTRNAEVIYTQQNDDTLTPNLTS